MIFSIIILVIAWLVCLILSKGDLTSVIYSTIVLLWLMVEVIFSRNGIIRSGFTGRLVTVIFLVFIIVTIPDVKGVVLVVTLLAWLITLLLNFLSISKAVNTNPNVEVRGLISDIEDLIVVP